MVLRTAVSPMAIYGAIRQTVRALDKSLLLVDVFTMEQQVSRTAQHERLLAWLCGSFGVLPLVAVLGAGRGSVLGQVLNEGLRLAGIGLTLGVPLALYGAKLAVSQRILPEGQTPVWTLAAALLVLAVSAFAAVFGPAMRASSVDPMQALRRG